MAIYHTRIKTFSRAKGHSSVAAAAYRAGLLLADERTGLRHDYRRRGGVVETRCIVPDDAPDWALEPSALWSAAEAAERRRDATVAREFELALPHELTESQRSDLAAEITRALVGRYGFAAQASIHSPDTPGGLNHHLHLLATTRRVTAAGLADKTRELDGGPSGRAEVEWIREAVARLTNAHLAAAAIEAQVDHRSLADQAHDAAARGDTAAALALTREPTRHVGKNATALHRRGAPSDRAAENLAITAANVEQFDALLREMGRQGRAIPTSDGHGHEQARRDRQRGRGIEVDLSRTHGQGHMSGIRGLARPRMASIVLPPADLPPSAEALFGEAVRDWLDIALAALLGRLTATRLLLEDHAQRLARFADVAALRRDLAELLKRFRALRRRVADGPRRVATERRASEALHRAERALEEFVEANPKPEGEAVKAWARRRHLRIAAVEQRLGELKKARDALGPDSDKDAEAAIGEAVDRVEAWSQTMLARYPIDSDLLAPPFGPIDAAQVLGTTPGSNRRRPRLH